jgi:hypothetical protein
MGGARPALGRPRPRLAVEARRMPQQGPSSQAGPSSRADSEPVESSDVCRWASYCRSAYQGRSAALRAAATSGLAGGFKTSCGFTEPAASSDVWPLHIPLSVCERTRGSAGSHYARGIRARLPIRTLLRLEAPRSGLGLFTLSCGNDQRLNRYERGRGRPSGPCPTLRNEALVLLRFFAAIPTSHCYYRTGQF